MKSIRLFLILPALFITFASCLNELPGDEGNPEPSAKGIVYTSTYYSAIPGTGTSVYEMTLNTHADGSVSVARSTAQYNSSMDLIHLNIIGSQQILETMQGVNVSFSQTGWYVPFDSSQPATKMTGGGGINIVCHCQSQGKCDILETSNPNGSTSFTCISTDCSSSCGVAITLVGPPNGGGNTAGIMVIIEDVVM